MPGIGVVFNPKSRHNLRDPQGGMRLSRALGAHGVVRTSRSLQELHSIAEDFHGLGIDVLCISGGDGTNTVTLTGFLKVYGQSLLPPVALLRGGTMNTVANSVGVRRGDPLSLLKKIVAIYAQSGAEGLKKTERHVLHVVPAGRAEGQYGFLFGTGVVHGFLAEYYAAGDPTPFVAAETLARGIGSAFVGGSMIRRIAQPFRGSVVLDDGTAWPERDYLAVAAGTVAHIGLQFKPFYRYAERPCAFHVLGIYASPAEFVRELPRIHGARPMHPHRAFDAVSSRMVVRSAHGPLKYMIDGDLHIAPPDVGPNGRPGDAPGEVTVAVGPRVRLVVEPGR